MLFPPAGEELPPELLVEVLFVVNNPDYSVVDEVYHKRPFSVLSISMENPEMLHRGNIFFQKKFRACNILPFSILMRKRRREREDVQRACYLGTRKRSTRFHNAALEYLLPYGAADSCSRLPVESKWLWRRRLTASARSGDKAPTHWS